MKTVLKIAEGLLFIADSCVSERVYTYPSGNERSQDVARLNADVKNIGYDMNKSISNHGKRTYQLTSN
ncbi:MAG: hypothetical protein Q8K61_08745 [Gallionella sp.]|nr:hypothetical protein [Gallionella sp.]